MTQTKELSGIAVTTSASADTKLLCVSGGGVKQLAISTMANPINDLVTGRLKCYKMSTQEALNADCIDLNDCPDDCYFSTPDLIDKPVQLKHSPVSRGYVNGGLGVLTLAYGAIYKTQIAVIYNTTDIYVRKKERAWSVWRKIQMTDYTNPAETL